MADSDGQRKRRLTATARRSLIEQAASELFAELGYRGASVERIAQRAGVSVPVVYDHFPSKRALYEALVDRHYGELRQVWFAHVARGADIAAWLPAAIDDWFAYVEAHPFAGRMLFRDATGDPELAAVQAEIQARSRAELLPVLEEIVRASKGAGTDAVGVELTWETLRAVLQGLAMWWSERRDVPRQRVVAAAMNGIWVGLERYLQGRQWDPAAPRKGGRRQPR